MDKKTARELREIAEKLPIVFEESEEMVLMSGQELNLSAYGEHRTFEKDKMYEVTVPVFKAVEHRQQLKDAYKKDKKLGVRNYLESFLNRNFHGRTA